MKRLGKTHARPANHSVTARAAEPDRMVPPPGAVVPPPAYYPPPGPYERLVYGGPPRAPYGGWGGYRGPYPY